MSNSYTTFPDSVQTFDLKTDVSSGVYSEWKQFNTYITNGEFANASSILQSNIELQKCIIDSVYVNRLSKTVEEIQTLFLNEIQSYIHETVINKGEWNAATKYVKYNFVTYPVNGIIQSFECVSDATPIATLPTNSMYWIPRVIQGEKGASGLGLTPRGVWNGTALYLVNDFVAHNNSFWQCLIQNSNIEPNKSSTYWLCLASLSDDITTKISNLETELRTDMYTINETIMEEFNNRYTKTETINLINAEKSATYNVSVPVLWSDSIPYSQTVTVNGIVSTDTPIVDIVLSSTVDTALLQEEAYACVSRIVTGESSITLYCNKKKPVTAFNIQLKVVK